METYRETMVREVALETAGLKPSGPRYRIASDAYLQLAAGTPTDRIIDRASAECLRVGANAVEDDQPNFWNAAGERAPLCADVASSIAGLIVSEPGVRTMSLPDALRALRHSDMRQIQFPQLSRALDLALTRARVRADEME